MANKRSRACLLLRADVPLALSAILLLCGCAASTGGDAQLASAKRPAVTVLVGQTKAPMAESTRASIESITGLKGAFSEKENVFKVSQPRSDLKVAVEGRAMEPFMGFTSWAAFTPGGRAPAIVAGDLVLFEDEISPAMDAMLGAGLSVTALHNHFAFESPRTFYMHIGGEGEFDVLARGVKAGFDAVRAVRAASPTVGYSFTGASAAAANSIPQAKVDAILALGGDVKSQMKDGMYKVVIGREVAMACGCTIGKEMGVNTWFALCGDEANASCSGDFLTFSGGGVAGAGELQPVLKALRANGIHVVAIHSHMEGETPPGIFLHYWGKGSAESLARGFKAALDAQAGKVATTGFEMGAGVGSGVGSGAVCLLFDGASAGSLPTGWVMGEQKTPGAVWKVAADAHASSAPNVLSLTGPSADSADGFNLCWSNVVRFTDGMAEVKMRADGGNDDQGGGLIWRVKDKNNYMVVRMNPLEDNFRLYYVKDGVRTQLATATVKAPAGMWHAIGIEQAGDSVRCSLDGVMLLEATDGHVQGSGGVGVWTKADARSSFDDLVIKSFKP